MQTADYPGVDDAFGHWLAGFIDGEGCFHIGPRSPHRVRGGKTYTARQRRYWTVFEAIVRIDDEPIIQEIADRTGFGQLNYRREARPGRSDTVGWRVDRQGQCLALCELLDRYPLRAKKARDYALWREAVVQWNNVVPNQWSGDHNNAIWLRMGELMADLKAVRRAGLPA